MSKFVIVTGANRGIGAAISDRLHNEGYEVIGLDIEFDNTARKYKTYKIDLSDASQIDLFSKSIADKNIYGIVNNAAIQLENNLVDTNLEDWDSLYNVNVRAPFYLVKSLYPKIVKSGSIVNISSVHSIATSTGLGAYASSKGALTTLSKTMSIEFGQDKQIRVNTILPGAIDTEMLKKGLSRSGNEQDSLNKLEKSSPLSKIGTPEDVANLASFLLNEELSSNITGAEFKCDSGILAKLPSE